VSAAALAAATSRVKSRLEKILVLMMSLRGGVGFQCLYVKTLPFELQATRTTPST
jgi:hypothetical protein